jgi:DNA-binding transcriptional ArsR family regulator
VPSDAPTPKNTSRSLLDDLPISELKAELFRALGNPGRVRILEQLVLGERSVGDLQPLVGLESSHLSQQLGVLRRANLVVARKEGNQVFYSVRRALLSDVLAGAHRHPEPAGGPEREGDRVSERHGVARSSSR